MSIKNKPRVLRGGSWFFDLDDVRASCRFHDSPGYRYVLIGFRLVLRRLK